MAIVDTSGPLGNLQKVSKGKKLVPPAAEATAEISLPSTTLLGQNRDSQSWVDSQWWLFHRVNKTHVIIQPCLPHVKRISASKPTEFVGGKEIQQRGSQSLYVVEQPVVVGSSGAITPKRTAALVYSWLTGTCLSIRKTGYVNWIRRLDTWTGYSGTPILSQSALCWTQTDRYVDGVK